MTAPPKKDGPPAGWRAEGPSIAVRANAGTEYATGAPDGNSDVPPGAASRPVQLSHSPRARKSPVGTRRCIRGADVAKATYFATDGRKWAYSGKRARVLAMLAEYGEGITQWDTLPWHTRLGGTIHALRRDGLDISTELEGECRHARYRLHTRGRLIIQPGNRRGSLLIQCENSSDSVMMHRENSEGAVPSHRVGQ